MKCNYCFIRIWSNGKLKGYMIADKEHIRGVKNV